jgi:hypothetical protein
VSDAPKPWEEEWDAEDSSVDNVTDGVTHLLFAGHFSTPAQARLASAAPDMARVIPKLLALLVTHEMCAECGHYQGADIEHDADCQAIATREEAWAALRKAGVR